MDKPNPVWIIEGNAFLCLRFSEEMMFPIVQVTKDTHKTSVIFLTLGTWLVLGSTPDRIEIDTKQLFLDLDIDDRILDRFKGFGLTIPSISTTDFLKG